MHLEVKKTSSRLLYKRRKHYKTDLLKSGANYSGAVVTLDVEDNAEISEKRLNNTENYKNLTI